MSKNPHIQSILQRLPDEPGVYQYLNEIGEVIYVGIVPRDDGHP